MNSGISNPVRFEIGPYWILIPSDAQVGAEVKLPPPGAIQACHTHWKIDLGRFYFSVHLAALAGLDNLKRFIDHSTKRSVVTPEVVVNGVRGVTYGTYDPPRTWIDWNFKKGDTMLCLSLLSHEFPVTMPTQEERDLHNAIVQSLKYCGDFLDEQPP